jgi:hypothetical protein
MDYSDSILNSLVSAVNGWYCPVCGINHPVDMYCMPEQLFWNEKIKEFIPIGQKLTYCQ